MNLIFDNLECCELLDYPDYPVLSVEENKVFSQRYLSYLLCCLSENVERRLLALVSEEVLCNVRSGKITVFDAFVSDPENKFIYVISLNVVTGKHEDGFSISVQDFLPMNLIPKDYKMNSNEKENEDWPLNDNFSITKAHKLKLQDLCRPVDFSETFTLRDVLNLIILRSNIHIDTLCQMVQCNYLFDYFEEAQKPISPDKDTKFAEQIEYLELSWHGEQDIDPNKGVRYFTNGWHFDGVGRKGVMSEDIMEFRQLEKPDPEYREGYAIDFSPINEIADLEIKTRPEMAFENGELERDDVNFYKKVVFTQQISLLEMLYAIFWELSFAGCPEERDEKMTEIHKRVKEYDDDKEKGEISYVSADDFFSSYDMANYHDKRNKQKHFIYHQENPNHKPICCQRDECKVHGKLRCIIAYDGKEKSHLTLVCPDCGAKSEWNCKTEAMLNKE